MLEKCINHSFCWNKNPLHETFGPESNLKKRGGGGGGGGSGPKFRKASTNLFIFISFFNLISRRYDREQNSKSATIHRKF